MPPKGRRPAESSGGKARDWTHADASPLEELNVGEAWPGTITNVSPYGVFVDIGAVRDARLSVPTKIGRRFRIGDELPECRIETVDVEAGRLSVALDDPEAIVQDLPPKEKPKAKATPKAKRGGSPRPKAKAGNRKVRDWGHADATPLEQLQEGDMWEGAVTNVSPYGVFVDIGAARDARLSVPTKIGRRFRIGDVIPDCQIETVDVEAGRVTVILEDAEEAVKDLPPKEKPKAASKPKAKSKARAKSGSRKPREWGHADAAALEDLGEGEVYEGVVTNVSPYGVFVDIGAIRDARLSISAKLGRRFRIGDAISECRVESIDAESGRLTATLDDPEETTKDLPAKEKPKAKAAPKAKSAARSPSPPRQKAKAKPKAKQSRGSQDADGALEGLEVGQVVDGFVSNKGPYGIFVDIGIGKDAKLQVPKKMMSSFRRQDEIIGMVVESIDLDKNQFAVSLDDPELQGEPATKSKAQAKPKAKPKAKQQAGRSTSRFRVGGVCDGIVTKVGPQGVFIDIGADADGLLRLPREIANQFRAGDEVHEMNIDAVDAQGKVKLSLEEPELKEPGAPAAKARGATSRSPGATKRGEAKAQPKGKAKAKAKATEDWQHPDGIPFSGLEIGAEVCGVVTNRGPMGVFLDIGAVKDGKLRLPKNEWRKFRNGDEVEEMIIEHVDVDSGNITLALTYELGDAPEEVIEEVAAPRKPKASPRPKSSSPGAQARAAAKAPVQRSPGRPAAKTAPKAKARRTG